jgi:hypothetical protein
MAAIVERHFPCTLHCAKARCKQEAAVVDGALRGTTCLFLLCGRGSWKKGCAKWQVPRQPQASLHGAGRCLGGPGDSPPLEENNNAVSDAKSLATNSTPSPPGMHVRRATSLFSWGER